MLKFYKTKKERNFIFYFYDRSIDKFILHWVRLHYSEELDVIYRHDMCQNLTTWWSRGPYNQNKQKNKE